MSIPSIIKIGKFASAMIDGRMRTMDASHHLFNDIITAITSNDSDRCKQLFDLADTIKRYTPENIVEVKDGVVYYAGEVVHDELANRIIQYVSAGINPKSWIEFLKRLRNNTDRSVVDRLFSFLENGGIPVDDGGFIYAYKKVTNDYKDCHTQTIDNSVGTTVSMSRSECNSNHKDVCSAGLHFCSFDYLQHFPGQRVVIVKVDPADVVAVPFDYNDTKVRCCKYQVIGELIDTKDDALRNKLVVTEDEFQSTKKAEDYSCLSTLTNASLVKLWNAVFPSKPLVKFRDKKTAIARIVANISLQRIQEWCSE